MAGNSVPAFFGAKAQTRRPSAVDVTITYDHSLSNEPYIAAFRNIANIQQMQAAMVSEGVGAGSDLNRYSMTSFQYLMHTRLGSVSKVWVDSSELTIPALQWADSRNVILSGRSSEDETGSIYNILTGNRSVPTLVASPTPWPTTTGSWLPEQEPSGPVIDGSYRAAPSNTIRGIVISQSTEEGAGATAILGTYGIANGPPDADYQAIDPEDDGLNVGPLPGGGQNTFTTELSDTLDNPALSQILVFIDSVTITCTLTSDFVTQGLIPNTTYRPVGAVFPSQAAATLIYAPNGVITSEATTYFVPNVPLETIGGLSPDAPGSPTSTNTYHYAKKSNGAVLSLSGTQSNFSVTFWALGKVLGKYLYDTSF